jgi:hypothetical protein
MAKTPSLDAKVNKLTRIVEKGFAAVAHDLSQRPTKSETGAIVDNSIRSLVPNIVREETKDMRDELISIRRDLNTLQETAANIAGLPKEIDHALERIAAIEKHLGIEKKIAA